MDGLPDCECGVLSKCTCNLLKKVVDRDNKHMLIDFLMGLDKRFEAIRGQILAMNPLPTVNQAFSKVHQSELQKNIGFVDAGVFKGMAIAVPVVSDSAPSFNKSVATPKNVWRRDAKKPRTDRASFFCDFCKKTGHTKDYCFKLRDLQTKPGGSVFRGSSSASNSKFAAHVEEVSGFGADTPCDFPDSKDSPPMMDPRFVQAAAKEMYRVFQASQSDIPKLAGMVLASSVCHKSVHTTHSWIIDSGASDHMTHSLCDCSNTMLNYVFLGFEDETKNIKRNWREKLNRKRNFINWNFRVFVNT
ncbi:hypothetical protein RND81_07G193000 [Saponaria officinalis]|uniref:Uncharacterized protein n=1 Tax=Saponaria officinalis TaxID=3572 RepID=A0AAW1JSQ9_SAPOF